LIIEEVLEAEARDKLGRERYERVEGEPSGYRNGYRTGRLKTAEGAVRFSAPQLRDTAEPFLSPDQTGHLGPEFSASWRLDHVPIRLAGTQRRAEAPVQAGGSQSSTRSTSRLRQSPMWQRCPAPAANSSRASSALSASTHHSSTRVTCTVAWYSLGWGFSLRAATAIWHSQGESLGNVL
jgi:Transposase, Mutator family